MYAALRVASHVDYRLVLLYFVSLSQRSACDCNKRILYCIVLYCIACLSVCLSVSWVLSGLAAAVSVLDSGRLYPRAPGDGAGL